MEQQEEKKSWFQNAMIAWGNWNKSYGKMLKNASDFLLINFWFVAKISIPLFLVLLILGNSTAEKIGGFVLEYLKNLLTNVN